MFGCFRGLPTHQLKIFKLFFKKQIIINLHDENNYKFCSKILVVQQKTFNLFIKKLGMFPL